MPTPEQEPLGPIFEKRLKAALDRVTPPSPMLSRARYRSLIASPSGRAWRLAPALVGIGAALMALTAAAATGSPNPAVWTERAGSVIQNVGHIPASSPKSAQSPTPESSHEATQPGRPTSDGRDKEGSSEPKESPEASPRPRPTPSERGEPSPTPDSPDRGEASPTPASSND
jgi:hypothetical protein